MSKTENALADLDNAVSSVLRLEPDPVALAAPLGTRVQSHLFKWGPGLCGGLQRR